LRSAEAFEAAGSKVMTALQAHFSPEFLNRVEDIVLFNPLGKEQLMAIVELRLKDLRGMLSDRKISLELTDAAKDLLATQAFILNCGARPLKRAIQRQGQDPLALTTPPRRGAVWRSHRGGCRPWRFEVPPQAQPQRPRPQLIVMVHFPLASMVGRSGVSLVSASYASSPRAVSTRSRAPACQFIISL